MLIIFDLSYENVIRLIGGQNKGHTAPLGCYNTGYNTDLGRYDCGQYDDQGVYWDLRTIDL